MIESQLEILSRAGLIQTGAVGDRSEYEFRHGLTRESVYRGLLRTERVRLHRAIGDLLERQPDRRDDDLPLLAHHFQKADDPRAFRYLCRAADAALAKHALVEAERLYDDALEFGLRGYAETHDLSHILTRRGRAKEHAANFAGAMADYEQLERLGQERDEPRLLLASALAKAKLHSVGSTAHDPAKAMRYAELGVEIARSLNDEETQARLRWIQALSNIFSGNPARAVGHAEQALEFARRERQQELEAHILNDLGNAHWFLGQVREALGAHEQATPLWRELGNIPMLSDNLSQLALFSYTLGELDRALELGEEAVRLADEIQHTWAQSQSRIVPAYTLCERGLIGRGFSTFELTLQYAQESGLLIARIFAASDWGWWLAELGQRDEGFRMVEEAEMTARAQLPGLLEWPLAVKARILLMRGERDGAAEILRGELTAGFQEAVPRLTLFGAYHVGMARAELELSKGGLDAAREEAGAVLLGLKRAGMRTYLAPVQLILARIHGELGQLDEARRLGEEALAISAELGSPLRAAQASGMLGEILRRLGEGNGADSYRDQARRHLEVIVANIEDESLRRAFWETSLAQSIQMG